MISKKPDIVAYVVGLGFVGAVAITGSIAIQNYANRLDARVERIMKYDTNRDGLDNVEFRRVFDEFDLNKNRVIEPEEIYNYLGINRKSRSKK